MANVMTPIKTNDITPSKLQIDVNDETYVYILRSQPQLPQIPQIPQILIDNKRKGWQRPYKHHK